MKKENETVEKNPEIRRRHDQAKEIVCFASVNTIGRCNLRGWKAKTFRGSFGEFLDSPRLSAIFFATNDLHVQLQRKFVTS